MGVIIAHPFHVVLLVKKLGVLAYVAAQQIYGLFLELGDVAALLDADIPRRLHCMIIHGRYYHTIEYSTICCCVAPVELCLTEQ